MSTSQSTGIIFVLNKLKMDVTAGIEGEAKQLPLSNTHVQPTPKTNKRKATDAKSSGGTRAKAVVKRQRTFHVKYPVLTNLEDGWIRYPYEMQPRRQSKLTAGTVYRDAKWPDEWGPENANSRSARIVLGHIKASFTKKEGGQAGVSGPFYLCRDAQAALRVAELCRCEKKMTLGAILQPDKPFTHVADLDAEGPLLIGYDPLQRGRGCTTVVASSPCASNSAGNSLHTVGGHGDGESKEEKRATAVVVGNASWSWLDFLDSYRSCFKDALVALTKASEKDVTLLVDHSLYAFITDYSRLAPGHPKRGKLSIRLYVLGLEWSSAREAFRFHVQWRARLEQQAAQPGHERFVPLELPDHISKVIGVVGVVALDAKMREFDPSLFLLCLPHEMPANAELLPPGGVGVKIAKLLVAHPTRAMAGSTPWNLLNAPSEKRIADAMLVDIQNVLQKWLPDSKNALAVELGESVWSFQLKRVASSACPACKRVHDHKGAIVTVQHDGSLFYGCWANDKGPHQDTMRIRGRVRTYSEWKFQDRSPEQDPFSVYDAERAARGGDKNNDPPPGSQE
jgi:hypothetical protein